MFANALTGGDVDKLFKGMEEGKFKAKDLATVAATAKEKAAPVLDEVRQGQAAQKNRVSNEVAVLAQRLLDNGTDKKFGDFFGGLADGLKDFKAGVDTLGKWFGELASGTGDLLARWLPIIGLGISRLDAFVVKMLNKAGISVPSVNTTAIRNEWAIKEDFEKWMIGENSAFGSVTGMKYVADGENKTTREDIVRGMAMMADDYQKVYPEYFSSNKDELSDLETKHGWSREAIKYQLEDTKNAIVEGYKDGSEIAKEAGAVIGKITGSSFLETIATNMLSPLGGSAGAGVNFLSKAWNDRIEMNRMSYIEEDMNFVRKRDAARYIKSDTVGLFDSIEKSITKVPASTLIGNKAGNGSQQSSSSQTTYADDGRGNILEVKATLINNNTNNSIIKLNASASQ